MPRFGSWLLAPVLDLPQHPLKRVLQNLLLVMLVVVVLATLLYGLSFGWSTIAPGGLLLNALALLTVASALLLLRQGSYAWAVWLVIIAVVTGEAYQLALSGFSANSGTLAALTIPITLAGVFLGRAALIVTTTSCLLLVLGAALLESGGFLLAGLNPSPLPLTPRVLTFSAVLLLLAVLIHGFGSSYRLAFSKTLRREEEVRQAQARLERQAQALRRVNAKLRREIAERQKQEALLMWRHQEFAALVENAPDIIARFDADLRHLYVNPAITAATGLPAEAFIGKTHQELGMPEETVAFWREKLSEVFRSGKETRLSYTFMGPNGPLHYHARAVPEFDESGHVISIFAINRDVTELRQAEEEKAALLAREQASRLATERANARLSWLAEASRLLASSLDYQTTLQTVADLAVPTIADWCVINVLDEHGELQRLALAHTDPEKVRFAQELQRRYPADLNATKGLAHVLRTGETEYYPEIPDALLEADIKDKQQLALIKQVGMTSVVIAALKGHKGILGAISFVQAESNRHFSPEDVDLANELAQRAALAVENARLYTVAQELNAELEDRVSSRTRELERMNQELEAFAYAVSHDLQAPLSGISGFSQAIVEDYSDTLDDTARHYLSRIQGNTERMRQLIHDILRLSKAGRVALKLSRFDLCDVVREVVAHTGRKYPSVTPTFTCLDSAVVTADEGLMRVALENLLDNAWKFTQHAEQPHVEFGVLEASEDELGFFVKDNGIGFSMQYANELFKPFQRLHNTNDYCGTGIGLATVKRIIERHGGRIWVKSQEGDGTTFFFTLKAQPSTSSELIEEAAS